VLCTDGLTDARNGEGEAFGEGRLREAIRAVANEPADVLVASVMRAIEAFAAGAPPEDDLTLLALRCGGAIR
jgi:phosphoserine phosphatase RsbU/P